MNKDSFTTDIYRRPAMTPTIPRTRELPVADLESRCLSLMTDEQALATWERFKAVRRAYVESINRSIPA